MNIIAKYRRRHQRLADWLTKHHAKYNIIAGTRLYADASGELLLYQIRVEGNVLHVSVYRVVNPRVDAPIEPDPDGIYFEYRLEGRYVLAHAAHELIHQRAVVGLIFDLSHRMTRWERWWLREPKLKERS